MTAQKTSAARPPSSESDWLQYVREKSRLDQVIYPTVTDQTRVTPGFPAEVRFDVTVPEGPEDWPILFGEPYANVNAELTEIGGIPVVKVATLPAEGVCAYARASFLARQEK